MKNEVGEILQKIYDSEVHLRIGWLWDGGVDYIIGSRSFDIWNGDDENDDIRATGETDIDKAIIIIANDVAAHYPQSEFAKWWI
jgi:hypothetical protein